MESTTQPAVFTDKQSRKDAMHQTIEDWCSDLVSLVDDARASEHFQDWLEGQSRFYGKFEAKASPFTAGMKPTNSIQPSAMAQTGFQRNL